MRTRTPLLLLIVIATLLSALGSIAAVAATATTAHACSVEGPGLRVSPDTNLVPGQSIEITGTGFWDLMWHAPPAPGQPSQPETPLCDFDLVPMQDLKVVWNGTAQHQLGVVDGPQFSLFATVPVTAQPGPAEISVGNQNRTVFVLEGETVPPNPRPEPFPQPQPIPVPEPWPCPLLHDAPPSNSGQPQAVPDTAPGFLPPCPEPCVDYAHTTSDGTTYDYKWDCPDPCAFSPANPDVPAETSPVWCPPPEPCQLVGGDAWACPEPCPLLVAGDEALLPCPDPCQAYPTQAGQRSPCPEPCPAHSPGARTPSYCPDPCQLVGGDAWACPEPCPIYLHGAAATSQPEPDSDLYCPDPCGPNVQTGAVWCPPGDPCQLVGGDAWACPEPCPIYLHGGAATSQPEPGSDLYCPDPCGPNVKTDAVWCPPVLSDSAASTDVSRPPAVVPAADDSDVEPPSDSRESSEESPLTLAPDAETRIAEAPVAQAPALPSLDAQRSVVQPPPAGGTDQVSAPEQPFRVETSDQVPAEAGRLQANAPAPVAVADEPGLVTAPMIEITADRMSRTMAQVVAMLFG